MALNDMPVKMQTVANLCVEWREFTASLRLNRRKRPIAPGDSFIRLPKFGVLEALGTNHREKHFGNKPLGLLVKIRQAACKRKWDWFVA
jgi:hypothetical protein